MAVLKLPWHQIVLLALVLNILVENGLACRRNEGVTFFRNNKDMDEDGGLEWLTRVPRADSKGCWVSNHTSKNSTNN